MLSKRFLKLDFGLLPFDRAIDRWQSKIALSVDWRSTDMHQSANVHFGRLARSTVCPIEAGRPSARSTGPID